MAQVSLLPNDHLPSGVELRIYCLLARVYGFVEPPAACARISFPFWAWEELRHERIC